MSSESLPVNLIPAATSPFRKDNWLGRTLLEGQDFLASDGFLSLTDAVNQIRQSGKRVILNIGDSSTSGWDTRVTVENKKRKEEGQPLLSAFFRYATYSDLLRKELDEEFIVLNAGIPGHTTLQGIRRLNSLLSALKKESVRVAYVSIYFGNNDSQWERNEEDKQKLLLTRFLPLSIERKLAKRKSAEADNKYLRLRTNLRDFAANYHAMIRACRRYGAVPILVIPETPLYWKPGARFVAENYEHDPDCPGFGMVSRALGRSLEIWGDVISDDFSKEKIDQLEMARELDFIVPRIKKGHIAVIEDVARNEEVLLVKISIPRASDDIDYFVDYCHPIGVANEMIAAELKQTIMTLDHAPVARSHRHGSLLVRILDSRLFDYIGALLSKSGKRKASEGDVDKDIYTLY
jgi:lysophospholipase L1-like esterase